MAVFHIGSNIVATVADPAYRTSYSLSGSAIEGFMTGLFFLVTALPALMLIVTPAYLLLRRFGLAGWLPWLGFCLGAALVNALVQTGGELMPEAIFGVVFTLIIFRWVAGAGTAD